MGLNVGMTWYMPFQMFFSGKALTTVGTEDHGDCMFRDAMEYVQL